MLYVVKAVSTLLEILEMLHRELTLLVFIRWVSTLLEILDDIKERKNSKLPPFQPFLRF